MKRENDRMDEPRITLSIIHANGLWRKEMVEIKTRLMNRIKVKKKWLKLKNCLAT